uniref:Uncharacterized protein n=1 Tax=Rhizophora mucronata TaxID=61149 RepID=A0A2P2MWL1_RHIMU
MSFVRPASNPSSFGSSPDKELP